MGRVTVSGKPSNDLAPGTLNSIYKQAGWKIEADYEICSWTKNASALRTT
ncbi:MAG: type II toxin-antitoxin system HicA family toxin [Gammaproteobacteria bacterium]|nr:type II toxin-antitoxin system HicA family toxin [Gammaproteobacteria bacterium]